MKVLKTSGLIMIVVSIVFWAGFAFPSWSVWTEGLLGNSGMDKILPNYATSSRPTFINVKGARNEWIAFQLAARISGESASNFVPSVSSTLRSGANTIADTNIVFYVNQHVNISPSEALIGSGGDYPDVCVPYRDRWYNEVRNGAGMGWGKAVDGSGSARTQPFLVEIYIPSSAAPGTYSGTIRLQADGTVSRAGGLSQDITVFLTVWDFTLPTQWSAYNVWATSDFYDAGFQSAAGVAPGDAMREYTFRMQQSAMDHGIWLYSGGSTYKNTGPEGPTPTFTNPYWDGPSDNWSWKKFLDGTVPQGYNPKPYPKTSVWWVRNDDGGNAWNYPASYLDNWHNWIKSRGYGATTLFLDKFVDEPSLATLNSAWSTYDVRHNGYPSRPYEMFTAGGTNYPPTNLASSYFRAPYKQVWTSLMLYSFYRADDRADVQPAGSASDWDSRRSNYGDILLGYNAGDADKDMRPNQTIGSEGITAHARANATWMVGAWTFRLQGMHNWQTTRSWSSVDSAFTNNSPYQANGDADGVYFYPGRTSGTSWDIGGNHNIPLESFRLKLFRWGQNLYEYGKLLQAAGKSSIADSEINSLLIFNGTTHLMNKVSFAPVSAFEAARERAGNELSQAQGDLIPPQNLRIISASVTGN